MPEIQTKPRLSKLFDKDSHPVIASECDWTRLNIAVKSIKIHVTMASICSFIRKLMDIFLTTSGSLMDTELKAFSKEFKKKKVYFHYSQLTNYKLESVHQVPPIIGFIMVCVSVRMDSAFAENISPTLFNE